MRGYIMFFLLVVFIGCSQQFIVLRDVPEKPVFTVFPASVSEEDISFANIVTAALINNGVKVVERPAIMQEYIETSGKSEGLGYGGGLRFTSSDEKVKGKKISQIGDIVSLYNDTNANYIFVVTNKRKWIKVIKKETKEILYSDGRPEGKGTFEHVEKILKALGISIRKK